MNPVITGALIKGGADLLGGLFGSSAANKARRAQQAAAQQQLNMMRQVYGNDLAVNAPFLATGQGANNLLAQYYGLPYYQPTNVGALASNVTTAGSGALMSAKDVVAALRSGKSVADIVKTGFLGGNVGGKQIRRLQAAGLTPEQIQQLQTGAVPGQAASGIGEMVTPSAADPSVFTTSPDYQFRRDEQMRGIEQGASARGGAFSGKVLAALTERSGQLASGEFQNWFNRMMDLTDRGQRSAGNVQNAGSMFAQGAGQAIGNSGDARASGILGGANSWANALSGVGASLSDYYSNRVPYRTPPIISAPLGRYRGN